MGDKTELDLKVLAIGDWGSKFPEDNLFYEL
jgi:hypothetical protein